MPNTVICFTGHRDCVTDEKNLQAVYAAHPNAKWIHGGAPGFDTQVHEFAMEHMIEEQIYRPDYETYFPKEAPLRRNEVMVNLCNVLVACYDGRKHGGTAYTIKIATAMKRDIVFVNAKKILKPHIERKG